MTMSKILPRFLSTLSVRRATGLGFSPLAAAEISIHALREESDLVDRHFHLAEK